MRSMFISLFILRVITNLSLSKQKNDFIKNVFVTSNYFIFFFDFCYQDEELARQLVELGYRGSGEVLKREEFEARKQQAEASRLAQRNKTK